MSAISFVRSVPLFGVLVAVLFSMPVQAQDKIDFATQIKPLLEKHCLRCHGADDQQGDFRIDDRDAVFSAYIEPGDSSFSDLYLLVTSEDEDELMPPPDDGGPMPDDDIQLFKDWIDQGAEWPEAVTLALDKKVVEEVEEAVAKQEQQQDATADNLTLFTEITGLLHPVLLHFPVALLIGGAFFALIGLRGESPLADAAYYCLWLGAWMAILACISGWFFAVEKNMTDWQSVDLNKSIDVHRWGGILVAVLAFLLALIASGSRRKDPYGTGAIWKLSMVLLAVLTGYIAHLGGKMTHDGLHDKLQNKSQQLYQNLTGSAGANAVKDTTADDADEQGAADEAVGKTSEETDAGLTAGSSFSGSAAC